MYSFDLGARAKRQLPANDPRDVQRTQAADELDLVWWADLYAHLRQLRAPHELLARQPGWLGRRLRIDPHSWL